jgi:hypothetical protein
MKTLTLVTAAVITALFVLPVDLDVQASVLAAVGLLSIMFSDYVREPKSLSVRADIVPFSAPSGRTAIEQAA